MTIQEFIDRTGLHPTEEKFKSIHQMYMYTNFEDKDAFCKEYKKCGNSPLVEDLMSMIDTRLQSWNELFDRFEEYKRKQYVADLDMATFLLGKAASYNDSDLESEAIRLTSHKTVILIKIKNNYPLTSDDFTYIAENLD